MGFVLKKDRSIPTSRWFGLCLSVNPALSLLVSALIGVSPGVLMFSVQQVHGHGLRALRVTLRGCGSRQKPAAAKEGSADAAA